MERATHKGRGTKPFGRFLRRWPVLPCTLALVSNQHCQTHDAATSSLDTRVVGQGTGGGRVTREIARPKAIFKSHPPMFFLGGVRLEALHSARSWSPGCEQT